MPLVIRFRDGRYCPAVVCDHCREEITDAADGNYQWRIGLNDTDFGKQVYFTHKRCYDPFEAAHKGELFMWGSMELACFPIYLGHNLALKWGGRPTPGGAAEHVAAGGEWKYSVSRSTEASLEVAEYASEVFHPSAVARRLLRLTRRCCYTFCGMANRPRPCYDASKEVAMIELTQEQRQRLEAAERIVPTNTPYVLIRKDLFERLQGLLADEGWTEDAYRAAMAAFARDGWDDPRTDVYDELDPRRPS